MSELTIQPSSIDNNIASNQVDTNLGDAVDLTIYAVATAKYRILAQFDFTALPAGATISAATLNLYYHTIVNADAVGRTYWAYEITQTAWAELQSTWNSYSTGNSWAVAGGDYTVDNGASLAVPASFGWMSWDVLTLVQHFQSTHGEIANFLIRDGAENLARGCVFHSREYTTDTSLRPKLVITYTSGAYELDCAPGSYAITGSNLTPLAARMINAGPGSYAISGANLTPLAARMINAAPGTYAITGADAGALANRVLSASPGSYKITGANLTPLVARVLNAGPGVYEITGCDATLAYSGAPTGGHYIPLPRRLIRRANRLPHFKY